MNEFSIDPSGEWSPRQAERVLEVLNREAEEQGIVGFIALDVSTFSKPNRYIIVRASEFVFENNILIAERSWGHELAQSLVDRFNV